MKRLAAILILTLVAVSCVPLYVPPVPHSSELPSDLRIVQVDVTDNEIAFALYGDAEGWIAVQWFAATGRELGSHSVWLAATGATSTAVIPDVAPGAAYVVFSYGEHILRVYHK